MAKFPDFIIFDDDPVNNTLCHITLRNSFKDAEIKTFTIPTKGFQYISKEVNFTPPKTTILFLDINMKGMTCWEFLERFEQLENNIKSKYKIFILSASLNHADKERAAENKNVVSYIEKPLTKEKVRIIIGNDFNKK